MEEYDYFMTTDMGMVTYLMMHGHVARKVEFTGRWCRWEYDIEGDIMERVDMFISDEAMVSPKEYNRTYQKVINEMRDLRTAYNIASHI